MKVDLKFLGYSILAVAIGTLIAIAIAGLVGKKYVQEEYDNSAAGKLGRLFS